MSRRVSDKGGSRLRADRAVLVQTYRDLLAESDEARARLDDLVRRQRRCLLALRRAGVSYRALARELANVLNGGLRTRHEVARLIARLRQQSRRQVLRERTVMERALAQAGDAPAPGATLPRATSPAASSGEDQGP